jgi:predicted nicotinamide N-methyase
VITETTRLATVPYVPEIRLQQAEDPFTVWEQTESVAGRSTGGATGADTGGTTNRAELPPPFWAFAWAGGQALARYLLDHPDLVAGRHVLDVASGSGLVAIAAARCGARPVLAADVDELAAQAISVNAAANGARVRPVLADLLDGDGDGAEVVLCADAFYEEELAVRVLAFLHRARAAGARIFVGDPGRAFLRTAGFVPLETYEIPVTVALEGVTSKRATVYEVTDGG